jgi:hypothetical protein
MAALPARKEQVTSNGLSYVNRVRLRVSRGTFQVGTESPTRTSSSLCFRAAVTAAARGKGPAQLESAHIRRNRRQRRCGFTHRRYHRAGALFRSTRPLPSVEDCPRLIYSLAKRSQEVPTSLAVPRETDDIGTCWLLRPHFVNDAFQLRQVKRSLSPRRIRRFNQDGQMLGDCTG